LRESDFGVAGDDPEKNMNLSDEEQIVALHEAGDRALMAADVEASSRIFADDYVQDNENGRAFKQDVLENFRSGAIRYPSIVSTARKVRLLSDSFAVVHGAESDEMIAGGVRSSVQYVYLDVLQKRDGEWRIVASQLARSEGFAKE